MGRRGLRKGHLAHVAPAGSWWRRSLRCEALILVGLHKDLVPGPASPEIGVRDGATALGAVRQGEGAIRRKGKWRHSRHEAGTMGPLSSTNRGYCSAGRGGDGSKSEFVLPRMN